MTAEISIMNKRAIALAADSAVTIGNGDKFYNTANKIFTLSKYYPVGIMVSNNVEFMGVPLEIIIKQYRETINEKEFKTLKEYAEHFLEFLHSDNMNLRLYESQYIDNFLFQLDNNLSERLKNKHNEKVEELQRPMNSEELLELRIKIINEFSEIIKNKTLLNNVPEDLDKYVLNNYMGIIDNHIKKFVDIDNLDPEILRELKNIYAKVFKTDWFGRQYSGLVIAGFGDNDIFPSLISYKVSGIIDGFIRYNITNEKQISLENSYSIIPFAQTETVNTFLNGISPNYIEILDKNFVNSIINNLDEINEKIPVNNLTDETISIIKDYLHDNWNEVLNEIISFSNSNYLIPILRSIRVSPKDELASMAESLVNLTSLKRQVSVDDNYQTVGGPIDVAVISKGDGFVWIKRKHYFEPKLNHHFFDNYYSNMEGDNKNE